MSDLHYKRVSEDSELEEILKLQKRNLPEALTSKEMNSQGFVSLKYTFENLKNLNLEEAAIICKSDSGVVAYILAIGKGSEISMPSLESLKAKLSKSLYKDKPISAYNYVLIGQVCVDKNYRQQGVFKSCYELYKHTFQNKYEFAVTFISDKNHRSLHAHKKLGFQFINKYKSNDNEVWNIALLSW